MLSADDKYSLLNRDKLRHPIQTHLSQKQKVFSRYTCTFLKFTLIFEKFQEKMIPIAFVFCKITDSKRRGLINV